MSYLKFDKTLMTNLEEALPREILRTNRSGAYHCTTIRSNNSANERFLYEYRSGTILQYAEIIRYADIYGT
jgi:hypothetical protein